MSARQRSSSRAVRTNGSITWRFACPASQTRPDRLELELEDLGVARVAQRAAEADHRVGLLRLEALAALQAAELVRAEVDRPVGDRPRREARGERRSAPSAIRSTNSSPRPCSISSRGCAPSSASITISSARSSPTPSTSSAAARSTCEGSERLTSSFVAVAGGAGAPRRRSGPPRRRGPAAGRGTLEHRPVRGVDGHELAVAQPAGGVAGARRRTGCRARARRSRRGRSCRRSRSRSPRRAASAAPSRARSCA